MKRPRRVPIGARAVEAAAARLGLSASLWELAVTLTGLLFGRSRDPLGF